MSEDREPEDNDGAGDDGGGVLVADFFFADKTDVINGITRLMDVKSGSVVDESDTFTKIENLLMKYQEIPSLLNSSMKDLCEPITDGLLLALYENNAIILDRSCKLFYLFCRIRGYKNMVKFLPNGVSHLEPCLTLLRSESIKMYNRWETRYTALLWMRILSLIPFSIDSIDSSHFKGVNLTQAIQDVCFECFFEAGPVREIAAYCLATLLTRPDMESHYLKAFVDRGTLILDEWVTNQGNGQGIKYFELIGVLSCLCQIYKFGHRDKVLQFAERVLTAVYPLMEGETPPQQKVRKFVSKLIQRVGMAYLPPRIASWRYQRGRRNLLGAADVATAASEGADEEDDADIPETLDGIFERLLNILSDNDTVVRWSAAKGIGRLTMRLPKCYADDIISEIIRNFEDEDDDSKWHGSCLVIAELARRGLLLPSYLQAVIDAIEKAMVYDKMRGFHSTGSHVRDSACYVCWACARAYSGAVLKPYIPSLTRKMLATFLFDREINCRRAASAAYQESVGRLGIDNFPFGLEIMAIADYFAVGNIANCYTQLAPKIASFSTEFLEILFSDLHDVRLNHWDENIRKLASQGMGLLAAINPSIAIKSLDGLAKQCLGSDSLERHGALLGVSEILRSVFKVTEGSLAIAKLSTRDPEIRSQFTTSLWEEIINIIPQMTKGRMFRGKGGDLLRNAAAYLIESLALIGTPLSLKSRTTFIEFLIENLRQPFDHIQDASMLALRTLLYHSVVTYAVEPQKVSQLTLAKFITITSAEQNVAVTRGYALAFSSLPYAMLEHNFDDFLAVATCLSSISHPSHLIAGEADPETRKNAIKSASVILCLIIDNGAAKESLIKPLWDILIRSCNDYSVDKRGDTGSWCRTAALVGLENTVNSILRLQDSGGKADKAGLVELGQEPTEVAGLAQSTQNDGTGGGGRGEQSHFNYDSMLIEVLSQCLKQMGEKIDSVRDTCGRIFQSFILRPDFSTKFKISGHDIILSHYYDCWRKDKESTKDANDSHQLNWSKPLISFKFLCLLLQSGLFVEPIIAGLVSTVGGSLGSVSALAERELVTVLRKLNVTNPVVVDSIVVALVKILESSKENENLLISVLRTYDILMKNDILTPTNCEIQSAIFPITKGNLYTSKNYQLIKSSIDVIGDVIFWKEDMRDELIDLSLCTLGHKYPKIRKYAADSLYVLFMNEFFARIHTKADLDQVSDWLVVTPWEGDIAIARDIREKICSKLNRQLPKPAVSATSTASKKKKVKDDELDSYASLVRVAGY